MKRWAIILLSFSVVIVLIFSIGGYIYVNQTLEETNIGILEEKTKNLIGPTTPVGTEIEFKEGALILKDEFKFFYLVSTETQEYQSYLQSLKDDGKIQETSIAPKHFIVNSDFKLSPLIKNDCDDVYCFKHYTSFDFIPPLFWKGIIAVEDARFLDHFGVDFISIFRAFVANIKSLRFQQGGSTISQQLVKNLFFTNEKTIARKVNEIIVSVYVEKKFPKEKILEAYLNEFQWGGLQGIRVKGYYAASLFYFSKRPQELEPYEIAILVSLLKGPSFFSPLNHLDRLKERANIVFRKMVEKRDVSDNEKLVWKENDWKKFYDNLKNNNRSKYFLQLWSMPKKTDFTLNFYERFVLAQKVFEIKQKIAEKHPDIAQNFAVKVLMKSLADTENGNVEKFYFYSKSERNLERAITQEKHQIGSTIKPILYSFLVKDFPFESLVSTESIEMNLKSGKWSPKDASKVEESEVTVRDALLRSLNRPIVNLVNQYGFDRLEQEVLPYFPMLNLPLREYPSQVLGSVEMSLNDLSLAFEKFIRNECEEIYQNKKTESESVLYVLSDPNLTTVSKQLDPIFKNLKFFGKTGTTNSGFDNWYVAFDGKYLTIVWVGNEGVRAGKSLNLYGSTTAFQVYQSFFRDRGQRFSSFSCNLISGIR